MQIIKSVNCSYLEPVLGSQNQGGFLVGCIFAVVVVVSMS